MTPQEAIERIKEHTEIHFKKEKGRCPLITEALNMAINSLEKQIPKRPDYEGDGYEDGYMVYDTWICPNCGTRYEVGYDSCAYCPECGQAIRWISENLEEDEGCI